MQTLIKTLRAEKGELYAVIDERRILLAKCRPVVEVYEHTVTVPLLGAKSYGVKSHHSAIALCPDPETTREVDAEYLRSISRFELTTDIQRSDGIFERFRFDCLTPEDIVIGGTWRFDVSGSPESINKLLLI